MPSSLWLCLGRKKDNADLCFILRLNSYPNFYGFLNHKFLMRSFPLSSLPYNGGEGRSPVPKSVRRRFLSVHLKAPPPLGRRQSRSSIKDFSHQSIALQRPPQLLMPGCEGNFINLLNDWMISHWVHKPTLTSPVNFGFGPLAEASIKESNFERFFGYSARYAPRKRSGKSFSVWFQFKKYAARRVFSREVENYKLLSKQQHSVAGFWVDLTFWNFR